MRKSLIFLLLISIFISGCTQYRNDPGTTVSGTVGNNTETEKPFGYIETCEAPGYFSNLTDFYKFATTGSRNSDDYSDSYTAQFIEGYASVEPIALLKIEDLFSDTDVGECVKAVYINYMANHYEYVLESEIIVRVHYDPKKLPAKIDEESYFVDYAKYVQEDDQNKFSVSSMSGIVYGKEVNGVKIYRHMSEYENFKFATVIDGYMIHISTSWSYAQYSSLEHMLNDPKCQFINSFLTDSELPHAINTLKSCIAKKTGE